MRSFAISAGRRAATGLAAGATVTAAQPSVQAREVVQQAPCVSSTRKPPVEDQDWLVTDFDQEVLVFKPFRPSDVDAAVEQVQAMMDARSSPRHEAGGPHSVVIEELDNTHNHDSTPASEAESYVSMGAEADAVLCQSFSGSSAGSLNAAAGVNGTGEVHDFLKIASKLLKRPGLQKEVFRCMLEDKEVCDLMLKQSRNIDAYLMAAGIHPTAGLLPAPEPRVSQEGEEGDEKNVLQNILEAVAACIDKTGSWLAGMGGWFKGRFSSLGSLLATLFGMSNEDEEEEGKDGAGQRDGSPKQRNSGDTVLGAVMVVTVAVFCVLLARSPGLLKTAAAGASAAAMAAQQQAAATRRTSLG